MSSASRSTSTSPTATTSEGLSYAEIHAPPADVTAVLGDPTDYESILPMTLESRVLWQRGRDTGVFLRQGVRAGSAGYALIVRRESRGLFRYWLDPTQPHEIGDLFGFFRVQPWGTGACLLTYAALVRLDLGVTKLLFSETIRRHALGDAGPRAHVRAGAPARVGGAPCRVSATVSARPSGSTPRPRS